MRPRTPILPGFAPRCCSSARASSSPVQGVAAGALRGLNDTRVPMLFAAISFWLIGFTSAYELGLRTPLGVVGIWIGFSIAIATFAVLLVWRFHRLTKDGRRRPAHR